MAIGRGGEHAGTPLAVVVFGAGNVDGPGHGACSRTIEDLKVRAFAGRLKPHESAAEPWRTAKSPIVKLA